MQVHSRSSFLQLNCCVLFYYCRRAGRTVRKTQWKQQQMRRILLYMTSLIDKLHICNNLKCIMPGQGTEQKHQVLIRATTSTMHRLPAASRLYAFTTPQCSSDRSKVLLTENDIFAVTATVQRIAGLNAFSSGPDCLREANILLNMPRHLPVVGTGRCQSVDCSTK